MHMKTSITKAAYTTTLSLLGASQALADAAGGAAGVQPSGTPGTLFTTTTTDASGHVTTTTGVFQTISDILIYIVGAVAVIMLIIGGFRYVISQGDAANVKAAKDTILYGIIGVVVAIMAFAIVNFVATSIK
jgi:hypothetical protein